MVGNKQGNGELYRPFGIKPAPGMTTASRAAIRFGLDQGHRMFGIHDGFQGLANGKVEELNWISVSGWTSMGSSILGTNRKVPTRKDLYEIARVIENSRIEVLLCIGGWV